MTVDSTMVGLNSFVSGVGFAFNAGWKSKKDEYGFMELQLAGLSDACRPDKESRQGRSSGLPG